MKFPVWFIKSKGGYFFKPVHFWGWVCYVISFADITYAFYAMNAPGADPGQQFKNVLPIVLVNLVILGMIISFTSPKEKEEDKEPEKPLKNRKK